MNDFITWTNTMIQLKQTLYDLKMSDKKNSFPLQSIEFFNLDPDYDVFVTMTLKRKKSQKKIGELMFEGRSE